MSRSHRWWCVSFLLFAASGLADEPKKLLILVQGPDGHPPATHEFIAGGEILRRTLADVPGLKVDVRNIHGEEKESGLIPEKIADADGVALYLSQGAQWIESEDRIKQAFAKLHQAGGGMFALHWAIGAKEAKYVEPFVALFGACHGGPDRKYKVIETLVTPADHPATADLKPFTIHDEFYYELKTDPKNDKLVRLLSADIEDKRYMVAWAWERPAGGRSAGFSGGHFHENWKRPEYRRFIEQTILWTMKIEPPKEGFPPELEEKVFELK